MLFDGPTCDGAHSVDGGTNRHPNLPLVGGIFVGGRSSRMGGRPKGLLPTVDGLSIVDRWRKLCEDARIPCVLVGSGEAYDGLGYARLADAPGTATISGAAGPLGGLVGLLRGARSEYVLSLGCDMPFVSSALLARLATMPCSAPILAPQHPKTNLWEPFFARYKVADVIEAAVARLEAGILSLQSLLTGVGCCPLHLSSSEWSLLKDWDYPDDLISHHDGEDIPPSASPVSRRR